MMLVRTYIAPSEIQGLGIFAGEFIPGGSQLWVLNPKFDIFLYREEIATLPAHMQDYVARYSYPHLEIDGVRIVDCDDGKFMNHNVRPNTDFRVFDKGYAIVDITAGEEITCNYFEFDPEFRGFGEKANRGGDLGHACWPLPAWSGDAALKPDKFAKPCSID
jgi:SET domain-containing protein